MIGMLVLTSDPSSTEMSRSFLQGGSLAVLWLFVPGFQFDIQNIAQMFLSKGRGVVPQRAEQFSEVELIVFGCFRCSSTSKHGTQKGGPPKKEIPQTWRFFRFHVLCRRVACISFPELLTFAPTLQMQRAVGFGFPFRIPSSRMTHGHVSWSGPPTCL